ncbi:lectin [Chiua virens]|nr:lectin [Chiua virens]
MSYNITCQVYQTNPGRGYFCMVEKTCWNYADGCTWSSPGEGIHMLTMGGSGTSGVLRFMSNEGERITIAVGVHNHLRWCDVATGLASDATGVVINAEYYGGGRDYMREKQLAHHSVTSAAGTKVQVIYTVTEGKNLRCNIIFG